MKNQKQDMPETINFDCYVMDDFSPEWHDGDEHTKAKYIQPNPEIDENTPNEVSGEPVLMNMPEAVYCENCATVCGCENNECCQCVTPVCSETCEEKCNNECKQQCETEQDCDCSCNDDNECNCSCGCDEDPDSPDEPSDCCEDYDPVEPIVPTVDCCENYGGASFDGSEENYNSEPQDNEQNESADYVDTAENISADMDNAVNTPEYSVYDFKNTVTQNDKGEDVMFLQKTINNASNKNLYGFSVNENGVFDRQTLNAILRLQTDWGMAATGEADREFIKRLLREI